MQTQTETITVAEHYRRYEAALRAKTNEELLEIQKAQWTIGAEDDAEIIAECVPIQTEHDREEVIEFLVGCEVNCWYGRETVDTEEATLP